MGVLCSCFFVCNCVCICFCCEFVLLRVLLGIVCLWSDGCFHGYIFYCMFFQLIDGGIVFLLFCLQLFLFHFFMNLCYYGFCLELFVYGPMDVFMDVLFIV